MKAHNDRQQAFNILNALLKNKTALSQSLTKAANVSSLTKEICFGVCRHYQRLEAIASSLLDKKPKSSEVWLALLMGLYQLQYMDQKEYAVVKETVNLMNACKKSWAKGLVNAVLRSFCRNKRQIIDELKNDAAFVYAHPQWLIKQYQADWPDAWQDIIAANNLHPPMSLRVNRQKTNVADYLYLLQQSGIEATTHPYAKEAITLKIPCNVSELPKFSEGWVSVQDPAAQLAVSLMQLAPGLRVLDACCAPGGKTGHILETEAHLAECVALDIDAKRLLRVEENLTRLSLHASLKQGDASKPDLFEKGVLFDRILLDAPCSATGVIRRHPDIKLLRTNDEIENVCAVQESLLDSLWPLLAKEGLLVYATCSVMRCENEDQIKKFVAKHNDCQVVIDTKEWGKATMHGIQILPGDAEMDGFFYSVLTRIR